MKTIQMSQNSSKGQWWLDYSHWVALKNASWEVDQPRYATKQFETMDQAKDEFELLTGFDRDDTRCNCCGYTFSFYEL